MKTLTSLDHPLVKELTAIRKEKKWREESGLCLIEGQKVVEEVAKKRPIKHLLSLVPTNFPSENAFLVTESILKKISGCINPDAMLATTPLPAPSSLQGSKWILALDRIQDPGNMGTLVRTALAFGWEGVFLVEGCCDIFHEKVLRATKGASLFLPFREGKGEELFDFKLPLFVGDLKGKQPEAISQGILVLGNEGQGVSPLFKKGASPLSISLQGEVDSLNVAIAGALLMAKLRGIL